MKTCTKCGILQNKSEFHKNPVCNDGLHTHCKHCRRLVAREQNKVWRTENADRDIAKNDKWKAENPEKVYEAQKKWRLNNKERLRVWFQNHRANKITSGRLTVGIENKLYDLQRGKCACCGLPLGDDYHLDHIMPLVLGGSNTDDNIQLLRAACNRRKHAKHPVDYMQSKGFLI